MDGMSQGLRELGVGLVLDDMGAGSTSLRHLTSDNVEVSIENGVAVQPDRDPPAGAAAMLP